MLLDVDTPILDQLTVDGYLTFDDTKTSLNL